MKDLNDLVSDSSPTLVEFGKINDVGQIVGSRIHKWQWIHPFLAISDNHASGEAQTSSALPKPHESLDTVPEVAQKTLERQMLSNILETVLNLLSYKAP